MRIESVNSYQSYKNIQISSRGKLRVSNSLKTNTESIIKKPKQIWQSYKNKIKCLMRTGAIIGTAIFCNSAWNENLKKAGFVEPEQVKFDNKEEVFNYAVNRITAHLNTEEPKEYSVIIDKNNNVVSECLGDSTSVTNYTLGYFIKDKLGISHHYIQLHGHPEETSNPARIATQSFSFQDFRCLNSNDNYKESYVVNKYGQFCLLRKNENFTKIPDKELDSLETKFLRAHKNSWANRIEIYKDNKVIHEFNDYQGMHAFWKEIADKYNLEYYTNFGVFEGIDAYENYYYPELLVPFAPTSHKNFEL